MKRNKKKKVNIGKEIASLFTKRKIISLVCSILSLAVAVGYFVYTAMCGFNIDTVTKVMGDTADGLWGFQLIKYASLNLIFSVLGIMLFAIFGLYRVLMAYYYFKIFKGKEDFYKSQRKETVLFSVLSLVMVVVYGILYSNEKITMPFVKNEGVLAMLIVYIVLALLPIVEMVGNAITIAIENKKKKKDEVPDKDKIAKEIDELAARNAELAKSGGEETKEETSETEEGFGKDKRREVTDKITAMLKKAGLYDEEENRENGESEEGEESGGNGGNGGKTVEIDGESGVEEEKAEEKLVETAEETPENIVLTDEKPAEEIAEKADEILAEEPEEDDEEEIEETEEVGEETEKADDEGLEETEETEEEVEEIAEAEEEKETAEIAKTEETAAEISDGNAILDKKEDSEYNISDRELERLTEIYERDIRVLIGKLDASSRTYRSARRTRRNRGDDSREKGQRKARRGIRENALRRSDRKRGSGRSGKGRGKKGTRKFRNGLVKGQNRKVGRTCRR